MKCECPYTLKVPLGNAFQVLFPVKTAEWKDGERTVEVADVRALTDVAVFVDGDEWSLGWEMDERGPLVNFPKDSLAKGPHNVEITADYFGVAIRAAYFECITMVQWSYESNIGNYIIGSPLVAEAAYIYVGITDDEELEALKQQYREATAACETARLAYEAAKEEFDEKAEQLDDVAQETTVQGVSNKLGTADDAYAANTVFARLNDALNREEHTADTLNDFALGITQSRSIPYQITVSNETYNLRGFEGVNDILWVRWEDTHSNDLWTKAYEIVEVGCYVYTNISAATPTQVGTISAVQSISLQDIYNAITDNTNGLAAIKTAASSAATDAAAAKTAAQAITGYATEANATANKNAVIAAVEANAGVPTLTIPNTTLSQELAPNTLYVFENRSNNLTLTLGTPIVGRANEYHFFLVTDTTAPTVTYPSGISWNGGSAPTIAASKTYEISILNNVAAYFEI